jgi:hypothetical protein
VVVEIHPRVQSTRFGMGTRAFDTWRGQWKKSPPHCTRLSELGLSLLPLQVKAITGPWTQTAKRCSITGTSEGRGNGEGRRARPREPRVQGKPKHTRRSPGPRLPWTRRPRLPRRGPRLPLASLASPLPWAP